MGRNNETGTPSELVETAFNLLLHFYLRTGWVHICLVIGEILWEVQIYRLCMCRVKCNDFLEENIFLIPIKTVLP